MTDPNWHRSTENADEIPLTGSTRCKCGHENRDHLFSNYCEGFHGEGCDCEGFEEAEDDGDE